VSRFFRHEFRFDEPEDVRQNTRFLSVAVIISSSELTGSAPHCAQYLSYPTGGGEGFEVACDFLSIFPYS
jgi:hypothetical protein